MALDKKKKMGIAGISSLLLVAMVIGVAISMNKSNEGGSTGSNISASNKAVEAVCSPTEYKESCRNILSSANSTDPKELIKVAFRSAEEAIKGALKNSSLLQQAATDPSTKGSFDVCARVLEYSAGDVERSLAKFNTFEPARLQEYTSDLRTWLSAAITFQETCIDAFENTTGDTGEKMKQLLKSSRELSSNGLAMVTDLSSILSQLQLGNLVSGSGRSSRRLLSNEEIMENMARRLLAAPLTPNVVVAQDGSGQFKTINEAIKTKPKNNDTFVIYIKAGVYKEYIEFRKGVNGVVLMGDGPTKTVITGNKSYGDGIKTYHTATVGIEGEDYFIKDIGIENTAGPAKHQAVALRASGDKAVFFNVHFNGYQDTLYAHNYRHFYVNCVITGTIDFVFGDALAFFQNCQFIVRRPMESQACMVTAQGRDNRDSIGAIVIQGGNITAEPEFLAAKPAIRAYLGRPWKLFSRTVIVHANIDGFIAPEGWSPWQGTFALDTLYYGEYENRGAGSDTSKRVTWKGIKTITPEIAQIFTPGAAYMGDEWVKATGVPYTPGIVN